MADTTGGLQPSFEQALCRLTGPDPIGVAVSGGGDSLALLELTRRWAERAGQAICVATVDHGLRRESAAEAAFVAAFCLSRDLPHTTLTVSDLNEGTGNLSARARDARYAALADWASQNGCRDQVLLGHTMDDQAETVLMRLARGSGVEGLSGMNESVERAGVRWLRPLLGARRAVLRDWLRSEGIEWIDDPTNDDASYDRIKARSALATLEPLGITVQNLSATADRLRRQRTVLEASAAELSARVLVWTGARHATLDRCALREAIADTAMRVLADTLRQIGGGDFRPRFRSVEPLFQRIISDETFTATLAGCLIRTDPSGQTLAIVPEPASKRSV